MKHMKKVLLVLCMVACLLGMTACTGQTKDNSVDVTLAANLGAGRYTVPGTVQ